MIRRILPLLCLVSCLLAPVAHAAVSVSASVESGVYERVFSVVLTVSDPTAKLFYTFEPDGSPMDAYAYTGAIRVERSTPLMYFAFTDPANESPIYRQDYELRYPSHLSLSVDPASRVASLFDYSADPSDSVALDGWRLEKDSIVLHEFAASEFARAGEGLAVSYALPSDVSPYGEYSLVAPDDSAIATHTASEPVAPSSMPTVTYGPSYERAVQVAAPVPTVESAAADTPTETSSDELAALPAEDAGIADAPALPADAPSAADSAPSESVPVEMFVPQSPDTSSEPTASSSASPDVTASARSFGGLLPIAFMFLVALAASAWRAMRPAPETPHKLR